MVGLKQATGIRTLAFRYNTDSRLWQVRFKDDIYIRLRKISIIFNPNINILVFKHFEGRGAPLLISFVHL